MLVDPCILRSLYWLSAILQDGVKRQNDLFHMSTPVIEPTCERQLKFVKT